MHETITTTAKTLTNIVKAVTNVQNTGKFEIKTATKTGKNKIHHSYMNFRTGLTPR